MNEADLAELRRRFALVPQETALFADTVAANIAYGKEEATRSEIEDRGQGRVRPRLHRRVCRKATTPCWARAA